jgi:two-component system response regulator FixJ
LPKHLIVKSARDEPGRCTCARKGIESGKNLECIGLKRPSLYLVDDDEALANLVKRLFERHGYLVVCYSAPAAFLDAMALIGPGCILTDLRMPQFSGVELLRQVRQRGVDWPAVVFSGRGDISAAVEAMRLGAADFVEKPFENQDLLNSIERAVNRYEIEQEPGRANIRAKELVKSLTRRQVEMMHGLAEGHSNEAIAYKLGISVRTAEAHRTRLMERLQTKSLADVVRLAIWVEEHMPSTFDGSVGGPQ